jgi:c-di-GMP-binding flagellar brake protein YcgR
VYYPQRRKSDRISLKSTVNIPFQETTANKNTSLHGSLANLSAGGLAFLIPLSDAFTSGDELQDCKHIQRFWGSYGRYRLKI